MLLLDIAGCELTRQRNLARTDYRPIPLWTSLYPKTFNPRSDSNKLTLDYPFNISLSNIQEIPLFPF